MHEANGLLTTEGWLLFSLCGVVLLALGCLALTYFAVVVSAEDRYAMARADQAAALLAPRRDDKERRDDADAQAVVSQVRADLGRDLARRDASSVYRLAAESREGRPFPPATA
jgi:predicted aminopeptidase